MKLFDLFETPIEDMSFVGNWNKNSSYSTQDRKLLNNPKAQEKIKTQWLNTEFPFNIIFVNSPEGKKYQEVGEITKQWLYDNMPIFYDDMVNQKQITSTNFFNPNAINVIFTNNSGVERVPMTAWVMAHRFGHVVRGSNLSSFSDNRSENFLFKEIEKNIMLYTDKIFDLYNVSSYKENYNNYRNFFQQIGTFKSARDKNLRNQFEFTYELIAQTIITGNIKFNQLGNYILGYKNIKYHSNDPGDIEYANGLLRDMAETTKDYIDAMLGNAIGKVFIM